MHILLIGCGAMGQRHLRGCLGHTVTTVDSFLPADFASVAAALGSKHYDKAIVSTTAHGRLAIVKELVQAGIRDLLIEKPLEQSINACHELVDAVAKINTRVNFARRAAPWVFVTKAPFAITVNAGALGLCVNGIHWIDLFLYMSQALSVSIYSEIDHKNPIQSPRGAQFCDFGGRVLLKAPSGASLYIHYDPLSSAPEIATIVCGHKSLTIDCSANCIVEWTKNKDHPPYLYGKDYTRMLRENAAFCDLPSVTAAWIDNKTPFLPTAKEALLAHQTLFDVLQMPYAAIT